MSERDWEIVSTAWDNVVKKHWNPSLKLFAEPKELRKEGGRGIDARLRRLLDSDKYWQYIHVYGSPCNCVPRNPFRWNKRVWSLIKVDTSEFAQKVNSQKELKE